MDVPADRSDARLVVDRVRFGGAGGGGAVAVSVGGSRPPGSGSGGAGSRGSPPGCRGRGVARGAAEHGSGGRARGGMFQLRRGKGKKNRGRAEGLSKKSSRNIRSIAVATNSRRLLYSTSATTALLIVVVEEE